MIDSGDFLASADFTTASDGAKHYHITRYALTKEVLARLEGGKVNDKVRAARGRKANCRGNVEKVMRNLAEFGDPKKMQRYRGRDIPVQCPECGKKKYFIENGVLGCVGCFHVIVGKGVE